MQCNPIVVDGLIYLTSPKLRVFALDAATGRQVWVFDPNEGRKVTGKIRNRGLTYANGHIHFAARQWLYALDAKNGTPVWRTDLREGLGRPAAEMNVSVTTPGVVYKDLLIVGSIISEALPASPGDVRAYDLNTGKLRWSFHTIPHPGEPGYETWPKDAWTYIGAANNWSGMSLDEKRGLVFVPTGSAAFDFYGSNRAGDNLYANSLLCLKAATGERVWHFQFVRHDVWDRDLPAPPNLVTVVRDGRLVDAVAQITKSGHTWVFDRETGKPLVPYQDVPVPPSAVEGEVLAKTQPLPLKPPAFARQTISPEMLSQRTPEVAREVRARLQALKYGGQFVPPSREGSVVFPGFDGGGEWGGAAFDPETGLLYVNSNEMAWILRIVPKPPPPARQNGKELYNRNCASCHKADFKGTPPEFPSLVNIGARLAEDDLRNVIRNGAGRMPGFGRLGGPAVQAMTRYLLTGDAGAATASAGPSPIDLKFTFDGYNKFLDKDGYPAIAPPWGTLNAIDLDKLEIRWSIPFGEIPALGLKNTGSENYGGPAVTASGLLFIGATNHDSKFHVFDKATGELLWETRLPAAGNATPAVYEVKGKQYVVIGAGGGKSGAPSGGSYVAFSLP
jgi:quinoprotein glucose dehydrogenase